MSRSTPLLTPSAGRNRRQVAPGVCLMPALLMLVIAGSLPLQAQETFVPPMQHPADRYTAAWRKNPFTLKTAPVTVEVQSFAKDLAIGSMYQVGDETTVVVVNTKTRERQILRGNAPSSNGMRVKLAAIKDTRKESSAIVELGGQEATLRYDTSYLKQMASAGGQAKARGKTAGNQEGKSSGDVAANTAELNMPAPHPPDVISYNLDAAPGDDNRVVIENNTGVSRNPASTPATGEPATPPLISTNLDAEPMNNPPVPASTPVHSPGPSHPALPPQLGEP